MKNTEAIKLLRIKNEITYPRYALRYENESDWTCHWLCSRSKVYHVNEDDIDFFVTKYVRNLRNWNEHVVKDHELMSVTVWRNYTLVASILIPYEKGSRLNKLTELLDYETLETTIKFFNLLREDFMANDGAYAYIYDDAIRAFRNFHYLNKYLHVDRIIPKGVSSPLVNMDSYITGDTSHHGNKVITLEGDVFVGKDSYLKMEFDATHYQMYVTSSHEDVLSDNDPCMDVPSLKDFISMFRDKQMLPVRGDIALPLTLVLSKDDEHVNFEKITKLNDGYSKAIRVAIVTHGERSPYRRNDFCTCDTFLLLSKEITHDDIGVVNKDKYLITLNSNVVTNIMNKGRGTKDILKLLSYLKNEEVARRSVCLINQTTFDLSTGRNTHIYHSEVTCGYFVTDVIEEFLDTLTNLKK